MKNIKRIAASIGLLACVLLSSCSESKSQIAVKNKFPKSEVTKMPDSNDWIVRKPDGSIWTCYSATGENVINIIELFPASLTTDDNQGYEK